MMQESRIVDVLPGSPMRAMAKFAWAPKGTETPDLDLTIRRFEEDGRKPDTYRPPRLPGDWDRDVGEARLSSIVQQVISSDFLLKSRFEAGSVIRVRIPTVVGYKSPRRKPIRRLADLAGLPGSTGDLVRPLLMREPDVSYLYPYQAHGVSWLQDSPSRLLADDMGLGKTLQAITAIRQLIRVGAVRMVLVISPKSLVYNWLSELEKWAQELVCIAINTDPNDARSAWRSILGQVHVVVTHYEEIRSTAMHLCDLEIDLLVADEAHRLRNESSQLTRAIQLLRRKRMWALTGTPIERDAVDLATLMSLLDPQRFAPSDSGGSPEVLRAMVRDYVLCRRRSEVLRELPPITESVEHLELLPKQRSRYEQALAGVGADGNRLRGALSVINELRQICDSDPVSGESAKINRVIELLREVSDLGEKAIVFSYLRAPLRLISCALDRERGWGKYALLDGTMTQEQRDAAVQAFRERPEVTVLLASSKVAGEGLTLTEANHVIFLNLWWNPSSNYQARDRVNRIGQTRPVNVYSFVSEATVEEYLQTILNRKDAVFSRVIGKLADLTKPLAPDEQRMVDEIEQHLRGVD